jgi:hypothetical protein
MAVSIGTQMLPSPVTRMRATTPRDASSVPSLVWIGEKVTTELYEVYSLEVGDTVKILGNLYAIYDIIDLGPDTSSLLLIDEDDNKHIMNVHDSDTVRVVCDVDHD